MTLESATILSKRVVDVVDGKAELEVEIPDDARGSVFLCASVVMFFAND